MARLFFERNNDNLVKVLFILLLGFSKWFTLGGGNQGAQVVQADFQSMRAALDMYKVNAGTYPSTEQGLHALVEKPTVAPQPRRWTQIMAETPRDPWNRVYQYELKDGEIQLWSKGPDEKAPQDDIYSLPLKVERKAEAPRSE